jgi:hypothetical protein
VIPTRTHAAKSTGHGRPGGISASPKTLFISSREHRSARDGKKGENLRFASEWFMLLLRHFARGGAHAVERVRIRKLPWHRVGHFYRSNRSYWLDRYRLATSSDPDAQTPHLSPFCDQHFKWFASRKVSVVGKRTRMVLLWPVGSPRNRSD